MTDRKPINIRLGAELDQAFYEFCQVTNRHEQHTARTIIKMFLQDGHEAADKRLRELLSSDSSRAEPTPADRDWAEHVVSGKKPGQSKKRKGKAG